MSFCMGWKPVGSNPIHHLTWCLYAHQPLLNNSPKRTLCVNDGDVQGARECLRVAAAADRQVRLRGARGALRRERWVAAQGADEAHEGARGETRAATAAAATAATVSSGSVISTSSTGTCSTGTSTNASQRAVQWMPSARSQRRSHGSFFHAAAPSAAATTATHVRESAAAALAAVRAAPSSAAAANDARDARATAACSGCRVRARAPRGAREDEAGAAPREREERATCGQAAGAGESEQRAAWGAVNRGAGRFGSDRSSGRDPQVCCSLELRVCANAVSAPPQLAAQAVGGQPIQANELQPSSEQRGDLKRKEVRAAVLECLSLCSHIQLTRSFGRAGSVRPVAGAAPAEAQSSRAE